jgi:hypothetical protein
MFLAHAVAMQQAAFKNVRDNFHIAVRMGTKASSRRNEIIVQHAKRAEAPVSRIVITGKRE